MNLKKLSEPFPKEQIEWRVGRSGTKNGGEVWCKVLAYIDNRAIRRRLDEVWGPENWQNQFKEIEVTHKNEQYGGFLCGIGIRLQPVNISVEKDHFIPSGTDSWVWKWDAAPFTDFEKVKGGASDAMKRAGYQWGIGSYLYDLDEGWAVVSMEKKGGPWQWAQSKEGKPFWWLPPDLPAWALPFTADELMDLIRACKDKKALNKVYTEHEKRLDSMEEKDKTRVMNQFADIKIHLEQK